MIGELSKRSRHAGGKVVHGMSRTPEYRIWIGMIQRCHNPNDPSFERYGGRGIKVCAEWRDSFQAFFDHIGKRPGREFSVDRIDNNRGYEPWNVRWATSSQQQTNTRRNQIMLTGPDGRTMSAKAWAKEIGLTASGLKGRFRKGLRGDKLFAPHRHHAG